MIRPLYEQISTVFSYEELSEFCFLLGVDIEDLNEGGRRTKALELQQYMQRTGQLNKLLVALMQKRPHLNLNDYLYLVLLEAFSSEEALTVLWQQFGLPLRDFPVPERFAWGSLAWREEKALALQIWAQDNGRMPQLLSLLQAQKADLSFYQA